jgi:hypothetical protein
LGMLGCPRATLPILYFRMSADNVFDAGFWKRWTMNFFDAGQKFYVGGDENHDINFHRSNCSSV